MKTKMFIFAAILAFMVSCSSTQTQQPAPGYSPDAVYDGLKTGMTKQAVIDVLGKDYKFDMNNVTQTQSNYVETLVWASPSDPNVAYVLTFVNNKLSRKTREQVVKEGGSVIQLPR